MCWRSRTNHPTLLAQARDHLDTIPLDRAHSETVNAHDRVETRRAVVVAAPGLADEHGLPGAVAVARLETRRQVQGRDEQVIVRHFILSTLLSAQRLLDIVRTHWSIENQLHWVLDVAFDEDAARNRTGNGPQNLALMRKLALNILRAHPDNASIRRKINRAAWDEAFLRSLLGHMR